MKTSITKHLPLLLIVIFVGLSFTTDKHRSEYTLPIRILSVFADDIDLDGDNDIITGHRVGCNDSTPSISILHNNGGGHFVIADTSKVFCGYQWRIFTACLDDDTYPDMVTAMAAPNKGAVDIYIRVYYNNQMGGFDTFMDFAVDANTTLTNMTYGDIDNDNDLDIVVLSRAGQFWAVLYNDGNGVFSTPEYHYVDYRPKSIVCKDLNQDGRDDIVVSGLKVEVYFSYANGFEYLLLGESKETVCVADVDGDGDKDILSFEGIALPGILSVTSVVMYNNQGDNTFDTIPEFYFEPASSKYFVSDFDNDSLPDILFQLYNKTGYILYRNQGNFQLGDSLFIPLETYESERFRIGFCADMDGNGYTDIIAARGSGAPLVGNLAILFNNGQGQFQEEPLVGIEELITPNRQAILSCYPNPFSSHTTFSITSQD